MTKGQRTIVALLAVVAVLLGLNLIVGGSTPAGAQAQGMGRPPQAVTLWVTDINTVYRMFRDGTIEFNQPSAPPCGPCDPVEWCGWQVVPE